VSETGTHFRSVVSVVQRNSLHCSTKNSKILYYIYSFFNNVETGLLLRADYHWWFCIWGICCSIFFTL